MPALQASTPVYKLDVSSYKELEYKNMKQQLEGEESDLDVYDYILGKKDVDVLYWRSRGEVACLTHVIFKAIIIILLYFKTVLINFVSDTFIKEFMFFFSVIDFWFTKNYNGKRLLGLHWCFSQDPYGQERFKYEYRINEDYLNVTNIRIFWLVQIIYIIFPVLYFYVQGIDFYIESNLVLEMIVISFVVILGLVNLVLFYKASTFAARKKVEFSRVLPSNQLKKLSYNSIISYL